MERIKLCLVINGFHNGGIEKVMDNYFSHMDRSKYDLHIITYMEPDLSKQQIFIDLGFKIHQLSYYKYHKPKIKNLKEHIDLFKKEQFDILHNNVAENILPMIAARMCGIKVRILHSHNDYAHAFQSSSHIRQIIYKMVMDFNARLSNVLIGCSKVAAISVFGKKRVDDGKVIIINNAIDIDKFVFNKAKRNEYRDKLNISDDEILVGHVGRYEGIQKNQEFVLNVFCEFLKLKPKSKLVMLGEGERRKEFQDMAEKLNISDKVIFTGAVLNVCDYYQAMDIFCFPSRFEGLAVSLIEAQCSGLPCVVSKRITDEEQINSNVEYLPLEKSYEEWAEVMLDLTRNGRSRKPKILIDNKYDINKNTRKLNLIYMKSCAL